MQAACLSVEADTGTPDQRPCEWPHARPIPPRPIMAEPPYPCPDRRSPEPHRGCPLWVAWRIRGLDEIRLAALSSAVGRRDGTRSTPSSSNQTSPATVAPLRSEQARFEGQQREGEARAGRAQAAWRPATRLCQLPGRWAGPRSTPARALGQAGPVAWPAPPSWRAGGTDAQQGVDGEIKVCRRGLCDLQAAGQGLCPGHALHLRASVWGLPRG